MIFYYARSDSSVYVEALLFMIHYLHIHVLIRLLPTPHHWIYAYTIQKTYSVQIHRINEVVLSQNVPIWYGSSADFQNAKIPFLDLYITDPFKLSLGLFSYHAHFP